MGVKLAANVIHRYQQGQSSTLSWSAQNVASLSIQPTIGNAQLPGVPAEGPIALQHHGGMRNGQWTGPPSLVQFRNIDIKELTE